MELGQGKAAFIHESSNPLCLFIDKHSDRRHKGRKTRYDGSRDCRFDPTGAVAIHDKPQGICTGSYCNGRVFDIGNAADLNLHIETI
jgi:hypothetical protein